MLTNTFLHIPYVSEKIEKKLWENNITSWEECLSCNRHFQNKNLITKFVQISKNNYDNKNHGFFSTKLLSKYHWRAYEDFKNRCCFLDIETTGLGKAQSDVTVIGIFDGTQSKVFINGINLQDFESEIRKYSFIVTFNGSMFDLPFLKHKFPKVEFNQFHADLRWILRRLGYTGGLKKIEKEFGIKRESDLAHLTGWDAVKLWKQFKRNNDKKALDILIRYNIEDIENLKTLMDFSYEKLKSKCFG